MPAVALFSTERRLRPRVLFAAVLALALVACGPNVGKADSYEQLADTMMSAGAFPAAISAMEKAVKFDSNEPRRWIKLARAQRSANQTALAAISYQHALDLDPANIEGLENMAILLVRAGQYTEARTYVDPLMALQPDDIAGLLALGAIAMYQRNWLEANKYADKLIEVAPSSIGGYSLKAHVLEAQGRPNAAAELLAKQFALNPTDLDIALQLMGLYRKAGNLTGVRSTSLALAKLQPSDPRYRMESARALWARGDQAKAKAIIADLEQRFRGNAGMIEAIAKFWLGNLPHDPAIAEIRAMAGRMQGLSKATLGDILIDQGYAGEAVRILAPVTSEELTADNEDVYATYSRALLRSGNVKEAEKIAEQVWYYDWLNDVILTVRAEIAFRRKKYADALSEAQQAVSGDNKNREAALLIPRLYTIMGKPVLAEKAWGEAQQHMSDDTDIHRQRIEWYVSQKRFEDARQIASSYASAHRRDVPAWTIFREICIRTNNPCASQAAAQLRAIS